MVYFCNSISNSMNNITHFIYDYLVKVGIKESSAEYLNMIALLLISLLIIFVVDYIVIYSWKLGEKGEKLKKTL